MALCSTTIKAHCFTLAYDNLFFTIDVLHSQTLHTLWVCQQTELYHWELTKKSLIKYHTKPHFHLLPNNVTFLLVTKQCHIYTCYHTMSYLLSLPYRIIFHLFEVCPSEPDFCGGIMARFIQPASMPHLQLCLLTPYSPCKPPTLKFKKILALN